MMAMCDGSKRDRCECGSCESDIQLSVMVVCGKSMMNGYDG